VRKTDSIETHTVPADSYWENKSCVAVPDRRYRVEKKERRMGLAIVMTVVVCNVGSGINELKNLLFLPRAYESREVMVEDRTRAHADHVGYGFDRSTTAAVGLLKAVYSPEEL